MTIHEYAKKGDCLGVLKAISDGISVDQPDQRGYTALVHAASSHEAGTDIIRLLIDHGADVNLATVGNRKFPIGLAAASGSIPKVQMLLDAGADISYESESNYTIVVHATYGLFESENLVPMIQFLHANGASIDKETEYGESPLSVASRFGRFDAVKCLLDLGADETPLNWTDLMKVLAWGADAEFESALEQTSLLNHQDRYERTVWHLAAFGPYFEKAKMLYDLGADINKKVRGGDTAMIICAERGNIEMLSWLIEIGADIEAVDGSGATALIAASRSGQTECLRALLEAGANPKHKDEYDGNAMSCASNAKIVRLLEEAGEDIADLNTEAKRNLLGLVDAETIDSTEADYRSGCQPRFGTSNPELMNVPYWNAMVKSGCNAYHPRIQFDPKNEMPSPLWCFDRFGMSFTKLPDGRFVQIAGEHEDFYDPDFYIYNDVIVHSPNGKFAIYGYPKDVFPPTDFHSATLVDGFIYILGSLGYQGTRRFGETPIYRLSCKNWSMEPLKATGDIPGWIFGHKCRLVDGCNLVVSGGTICKWMKGKEVHEDNSNEYELDLETMKWTWKS